MIKKLHLRLTLFCTLITSLILIIVSIICLIISENHMRLADKTSMHNNITMINGYLAEQTIISHKWIANAEANYAFYIHLDNNGNSFMFDELRKTSIKEMAFNTAREIAKNDYGFSLPPNTKKQINSNTVSFEFSTSDKQSYYASTSIFPKKDGYLSAIVLHPYSILETQILNQRTTFAIAIGIAVLSLLIFFHFLTAYLLKPLEKNRKNQALFIASASHELRSPLAVISSTLSAMKLAKEAKREEFSGIIESEVNRMSILVDDLLTITQADSGTWKTNFTLTELDTLMLQIYEKYEPLAASQSRQFIIRLPEDNIPLCCCDSGRIEQLFHILIDNAFCYTRPNDVITLATSATENEFHLSVSDTGLGIPDSEKEYVFDRFYRIDRSRNDKSHFGLGLCIAREIVILHKGHISITDTPNGGATFVITLPRSLNESPHLQKG